LPVFTQAVLRGDEHVFTLLLASFSVGIGIGSLLCERLSGRKVEIGLVPFGSIGLTLFAIDLWLASRGLGSGEATQGVGSFLMQWRHWRILADIVLLGVFGGFYIVPLYALIQTRSEPSHRSRMIAANNILNALFIVVSAGVAIGLLKAGLTIPQLFLAVGLHERGRRGVHLRAHSRVPHALPRLAARALGVPGAPGRRGQRARGRPVHHRVQPRELRRCRGDRRLRAPSDPLRHGPPHLPHPGAVVHLPHDARDPDRPGARGSRR
jgi:hypothetical protein